MSRPGTPADDIGIVEERGSHWLVCRGRRFAVVECRDGKIYNLRSGNRRAFANTAEGIASAVGEDWTDEASARRAFDDIAQRGEGLAQRIW